MLTNDSVTMVFHKARKGVCMGVLLALLIMVVNGAQAFECTNAGSGLTSNDTNDPDALACGSGAEAGGLASTALGDAATSAGIFSVAVGKDASAGTTTAIALGYDASAGGGGSLALGAGASVPQANSVGIGLNASTLGEDSVVIGSGASTTNGDGGIAIGHDATVDGPDGIAIGRFAESTKGLSSLSGIVIGNNSTATGTAISLGHFADAGGTSVALGFGADSLVGASALAAGSYTQVNGFRSSALGYRAQVDQADSLVLGSVLGFNSATGYANVGIGTTTPSAPLHIRRTDTTTEFLLLESEQPSGQQDRAMMFLANKGGIRFEFANQSQGTSWRFQAATGNEDRFEVTKVGTGEIEMALDAAGNLELQGMVTQLSDRDAKQDISALQGDVVLEKIARLPISEWSYKDSPGARHAGPMAQDFHATFGLGRDEKHLSPGDVAGVSLAAVKSLARQNQALTARNAELEDRMARLESLVQSLLPKVAER